MEQNKFIKTVLCPYCLEKIYAIKNIYAFNMIPCCDVCHEEAKISLKDRILRITPRCKNGDGGRINAQKCGFCKSVLPYGILDYDKYLMFSILGTPGAGKSNFLTTMITELQKTEDFPWKISHMDDQTKWIFDELKKSVYVDKTKIEPTRKGADPIPLLWNIRDISRMQSTTIPTYSLTVFDRAGEDYMCINPAISRYIDGSKALIILIDPLSLPKIAAKVDKTVFDKSISEGHVIGKSADMVKEVVKYIRQNCSLDNNKRIEKKVAVVFTKLDTVENMFGTATVTKPSPHLERKGFVKSDADAVDAEIRDWLQRNGESEFLNEINMSFAEGMVRYFGVSSYGHPPVTKTNVGTVIPRRIADPLIWMLYEEGIAPEL